MTIIKRKKNSRFRGSHTHGYGSKKKHRGAGSKGGHGGTGKRGDSLKPSIWKDKKYFGKHGFKSVNVEKIKTINIKDIQDRVDLLIKKGYAQEKNGLIAIDISILGYNKLLGTGKITRKLEIKTKFASKKTIEKIEKAGGKVEITKVIKKVQTEQPAKPKEKKAVTTKGSAEGQ